MSGELRIEREAAPGITVLTIDRPRAANAINPAVSRHFCAAIRDAQADPAQHAVVLSGAGDRVFCAGADLKNPDNLPPEIIAGQRAAALKDMLDAVLGFTKPLVCAVNGVAAGAGAMLALLSDHVVMADTSRLVLPEIDVGMPTLLGLAILTDLAGSALAADLVLSGRPMPAAEAAERGLAARVSPAAVRETALAAAAALAAKPATAFGLNKAWVQRGRREVLARAIEETERSRPQVLAASRQGEAA